MKNAFKSQDCIFKISADKYDVFLIDLQEYSLELKDLSSFKNKPLIDLIKKLCAELFSEEINQIISLLNNPLIGIAALDIPESQACNSAMNSLYGAAIVMGIFSHIGRPTIDSMNKTPFTIHTASYENAKRLDASGLEQYSPEVKLGFHNDGLICDEELKIPHHIAVYNLYISYRRPGNFMWIPTAAWREAQKFEDISTAENMTVKIRLTPSYYHDKQGKIQNSMIESVEVPVCCKNKKGERRFFLNGKVSLEDNSENCVTFIQSIRDSLHNNPEKILIPQKERRAFFLKNITGFHARDIFEDPIENVDLTRVFIRAVDQNAETYMPIALQEVPLLEA